MKLVGETKESDRHGTDIECLLWYDGHLLSSSDDGMIKIWTRSLELVDEWKANEEPVYQMAGDISAKRLYTSSDKTISIWRAENGKLALESSLEGHEHAIRRLAFVDGKLYSGDDGGEVKIWEAGKMIGSCSVLEEVWDLQVQENMVYTVRDKDVVVSEVKQTGRIRTKKTLEGRAPLLVLNNRLCCCDRTGMNVLVHNLSSVDCHLLGKLQGHTMIINGMAGAGNCLYTGGWDKSVISWDLERLSILQQLETGGNISAMTFVGAEQTLFVAADKMIKLIKTT